MNDRENVHNYDGPVFNAAVSNAQFAWNNESVTQNQQNNSTVAPGFEALAALVEDLLQQLPGAGLADRHSISSRPRPDHRCARHPGVGAGRIRPSQSVRVRRAVAEMPACG
ncbi:putative protein OS=Streptomyces microflavus OX=1919 GN=Smic_74750 PE=4 SV=1 [Streptomyces microflavus]